MADEERKQFALEELASVFEALERLGHPCVLIGGQCVCYWARRYLSTEPALQEIAQATPLLSKDVDFHGQRQAVIALARAFGTRAQVPSFREAFGNLLAGKFSVWIGKDCLSVEVLWEVPGLAKSEVAKLSTIDAFGPTAVQLLNPIGIMLAKAWNVAHIRKAGRRDAEQLLLTTASVRAFLRSLLEGAGADRPALRAALRFLEHAIAFTELPTARKAAGRCGVDWSQILPHRFIAASEQPELVLLREQRVPRWLRRVAPYKRPVPENPTLRRLLDILAAHAEPLCAQPVPPGRKSKSQNQRSPSP
ncbi:MAG: hypothetical protein HYY24_26465 [Verrucomicrobia bacterium]|nr:hypothetical protein [Verrucomicrobiota bacterium]